MNKYRLLIVDDHAVLREGLVSLLMQQPDFEVVGEAGTRSEAVTKACELKPDLILMDISLPDGSGVAATRTILAQHPEIKIVMLTIHDSGEVLLEAMRSGAKGYLMKNTTAKDMIASLRALSRGEFALSREMTGRILSELSAEENPHHERVPHLDLLTTRELEVLKKVSSGATNKEIARELFISVNTVKNHIHGILGKLELKNRREITLFAIRYGLSESVPR